MESLARKILKVVHWDDSRDEWEVQPPRSWVEAMGMVGNGPNVFPVPAGSRSLVMKKTGMADMVSGSTHILLSTFELSSANGEEVLDREESMGIIRTLREGRSEHHLKVNDVSGIPACVEHIMNHVSEHTLDQVGPIRVITRSDAIAWRLAEIGISVSDIIIHPLVGEEEVFIIACPGDLGVFFIKEDRHLMGDGLVEEIGMCVFDDRRFMGVKVCPQG